MKNGNTLIKLKYLLFRMNVKDFQKKLDRWIFDQEMCLKGIDVAVFMVREISLGKRFWVVSTTRSSTKTASTVNFNLCTLISNRLLHKIMPAFFLLIMSHSFFIAIIRRVLKEHFAWKQLKVDYSKNIWKEENRRHSFVCLSVGYISVKKLLKTLTLLVQELIK